MEETLGQAILAVGTDAFCPALRAWLAEVCEFDNMAIIAFFQTRGPQVLWTQARDRRVFDRIDSDYVKGAYLLDPFFSLHQGGAADGLYRLTEVAPDQFQRNEYFKSYYARTTLTDELAFFSTPAPGVSLTICVGRDATTPKTGAKFLARSCAAMRRVAPVVNALARSHWRDLRAEAGGSEDLAAALRARLSAAEGIALSGRQSEVALLILQGHSSISIGLALGISPQTVKVIRKQLYRKCGISSQGELYYLIAPHLERSG
ncbi:MAG: helix-turn-helix transcriptional regulator [Silicimonas sp.]|nr:helix-turn-helix transcriptional regulator [Silicimonas sp.]